MKYGQLKEVQMILMDTMTDQAFLDAYLMPILIVFAIAMGAMILFSIFHGLKEQGIFNVEIVNRNYQRLREGIQDVDHAARVHSKKMVGKSKAFLHAHYAKLKKQKKA